MKTLDEEIGRAIVSNIRKSVKSKRGVDTTPTLCSRCGRTTDGEELCLICQDDEYEEEIARERDLQYQLEKYERDRLKSVDPTNIA